ncbi:284cad9f-ae43-43d9-9a42-56d8d6e78cde [Sclerotinia trifoliorum]|uniref:284cad9f-ae43-43d9-9a42-56d8d6e78cde n=1 Tax=Sclerotinia trifoliorum TaxID=28548 RepID=A0A8H2W6W1_9HELO|nr:284cad9f-ae43-43d9-9a42-56d8d6e78cde [Sclerotinia trifoliorum]
MANISQLITSTERDENFEKARVERLRAMASEKYQEFKNEVLGIAGKVNGLGSSRFAVGEQKKYKVTPGGPKNLDLDENSLCRYTPSPSSKMNVSPNENDVASQPFKLGSLENSRLFPEVFNNVINQFHSQSSSGESILRASAVLFTPTKTKSGTSSFSGSSHSFAPESLEVSPSDGGGVCLVSSTPAVVKDSAAKKPNHQKLFEQMLLKDHENRMSKFQTVTPTKVDSGGGVIRLGVSSPAAVIKHAVAKKQISEGLMEQKLCTDWQKRLENFQPAIPTKENTSSNENVPVATQEPLGTSRACCTIEDKSNDVPVVTKSGGASLSEKSSSNRASQAVSIASSIMKKHKVIEMMVNAEAENHGTRASVLASFVPALSISDSSVQASISDSHLQISRNASGEGSKPLLTAGPTQQVISGPFLMKENEFMAMLVKRKQEKDLKKKPVVVSTPIIKKHNPKLNIRQAGSDFSVPQTQTSKNEEVVSGSKITVEQPELPNIDESTFVTPITSSYITTMSNKPLIPAPVNKWTTSKLTQGKALSKADEDFQAFLVAKKTATNAGTQAQQQQAAKQHLSPKPSSRKPTQAEDKAEKLKLAAGEANFNALLARRFAHSPTSQSTKLPTNNTNPQLSTPKNDGEAFGMAEPTMKDGQAIVSELKAASKDFVVTNVPKINAVDVFNTNPLDEKVISTLNTASNNYANMAGNLATFKGESSQDKISHVAVHSFTPNEEKNAYHSNTQVNNPINGKPSDKKSQAGSLLSSPPFWSISSFSDIADKMGSTAVDPNVKEGVRATATQEANLTLCDWDGSWCAPPIWEERGAFDSAYIPSYIHEWSAAVSPIQPVIYTVDTSAEGFISGKDLVNNVLLSKAPRHEPTIPDTLNASNEEKRRNQTAGQEAAAFLKKFENAREAREYAIMADNARHEEIMAQEPEPNPYAPKIEIYLRPATEADAKEILQIYNHYIIESYTPEDQEPLAESDILFLIQVTKNEKLPFVVAVKGRIPAQSANPKIKTKVPQYENIIGFGYTEMRGCGIAGKSNGRSRYTHNLHFYTHPDYTRKGVGSCVLDRLLLVSSRAYSSHDGYDWLNYDNDPAYGHGCGARCHQLLIEVPVLRKDDPNYKWVKSFLRRFWFLEEFRLSCVGRSSVLHRAGEWLDVVHFQKELEHEAEFTPFV